MSTLESKDLSNQSIIDPQFDKVWVLARTGEVREETNDRGTNLIVPLIFEEPVTSTDGRRVEAGYDQIRDRISLTPSGNLTQDFIDRKLAAFQIAALRLPGPKGCAWGSTSQYSGKLVRVFLTTKQSNNDPSKINQYIGKYEKAP